MGWGDVRCAGAARVVRGLTSMCVLLGSAWGGLGRREASESGTRTADAWGRCGKGLGRAKSGKKKGYGTRSRRNDGTGGGYARYGVFSFSFVVCSVERKNE